MIVSTVRCDRPGCTTEDAKRFLMLDLGAIGTDNYYVPGAESARLHLCATCAASREGRAFLLARIEKAATTLVELKS